MVENEDQGKEKKHYTVVIERMALAGTKVLIWALIAGVTWYYFWIKYTQRLDIASPEAFEYAQIARNNLHGEWFRTNMIRPVGLWLDPRLHDHPDRYHPPGYSVVLAGLMLIGGANNGSLLAGSAVFYFLVIPVLYFASRAMFGKRIARLGLAFYIIMPALGVAAVSGTPAMLATFLITTLFALLSAVRPRRYLVTALAGLALGACALTASRYALLILPAVGYLVLTLRRRAWAHVPILVGIAVLSVVPWAWRNVRVSGSPWPPMERASSHQLVPEREADTEAGQRTVFAAPHAVERSFSPAALRTTLGWRDMLRAFFQNLRIALGDLAGYVTQSVLVILFLAGVLVRLKNRYAEWFRIALYVAIVIDLTGGAVARPDSFLLLPYLPFIVVLGTVALFELTQRLGYSRPISRFAVIAVVIAVAIGQTIVSTNPAGAFTEADRHRAYTCRILEHFAQENLLEPDAVVLSNVPWHTAWYLDRPSIWLPPDYEDLMRIRMQTDEKITFAFLAGYALNESDPSYEIWERGFREGRMPDSFGLTPFLSTIFSRWEHVYTSFISLERREVLRQEAEEPQETPEPSGQDERPKNEEEP